MGSRFLPWSKVVTKDFLPILSKPVIQYVIDEIKEAGITEILIVTKKPGTLTEAYFEPAKSMEEFLKYKGKDKELEKLLSLNKDIKTKFIYQDDPRAGNSIALKAAKGELIEDDAFLLYYIDDLIDCGNNAQNRAQLLVESYRKTGKSTVSIVKSKSENDPNIYGMPIIGDEIHENLFSIKGIKEKPGIAAKPSSYISTAGYVLNKDIWDYLDNLVIADSGEYEITDALELMARDDLLNGLCIDGVHLDTGNPLSYLKTQLYFALNKSDNRDELRQLAQEILNKEDF